MQAARIIGGAGTGKTAALLAILTDNIERGLSPWQIGFCSFTRQARREASSRAAELCNIDAKELETNGQFKTLHAVCFQSLGSSRGEILTDDKKSRQWIEAAVQQQVSESLENPMLDGGNIATDDDFSNFEVATEAGKALTIWEMARARLETLESAWHRLYAASINALPGYEFVSEIVDRYEQLKRIDGRCDFTDLLGRFAGWNFHIEGHERTQPDGTAPEMAVWIHDECQDTSALAMSAFERLIGCDATERAYLAGDPFQSIFHFAGADPQLFLKFPCDEEMTMPRSYRCGANILATGEHILQNASDYFDRGIAPADHAGFVEHDRFSGQLIESLVNNSEGESWLLLARTNYHANRMTKRLDEMAVPWVSMTGRGGWGQTAKHRTFATLYAVQYFMERSIDETITSREWREVIKQIPAGKGENALLERGSKSLWEDAQRRPVGTAAKRYSELCEWGATPQLLDVIRSGDWQHRLNGGESFVMAVDRWGIETVMEPKIRAGTIHSAKGAEADNVFWLTSGSRAITNACDADGEQHDVECRVAYVAATRARNRLVIAVEPNKRHRFRM